MSATHDTMVSVCVVVFTVILFSADTFQQSTSSTTGDGDGDECWNNPCIKGRCVDGYKSFTCECPHIYNGTRCENDLSVLGCDVENICLNNGTCQRLTGQGSIYRCYCVAGYTGINCETEINECRLQPCSHGTCDDLINGFKCNCSGSGYRGPRCNEDINECAANPHPCGNGTCFNNPGSFSCECPVGFRGVGCLEDVNECQSNPCLQGGTCTSGLNDYTCACPPGFEGKRCEVDVDECVALNITCTGANTHCVNQVNGYRCECKDGYAGLAPICRDIDECALNPCLYGATCDNLENAYFCHCPQGYNGTRCEINLNDCEPNPCINGGTCQDGTNGYSCHCVPGYTGVNCSVNIQECDTQSYQCLHGATCEDGINTFHCLCNAGWTGRFCDVDIEECVSNPCANGAICQDYVNYYNCTCLPGFSGFDCSTNINDCSPNPCRNGGGCSDAENDYNCSCPDDWMGKNCTEPYNACIDLKPCQNGGTCYSEPPSHTYNCTCLAGFDGTNCQNNIDDCPGNTCLPYQQCNDRIQNYTCDCPKGFSDPNCSTEVNECDANPCQNGGTCLSEPGDYTCTCPTTLVNLTIYTPGRTNEFWSGWEGKNCDVDINECNASVPACLQSGICKNYDGYYTCACENRNSLNFGFNCETVSSYCQIAELNDRAPPCMNGGTCMDGTMAQQIDCMCAPGFTGNRCQNNIDDCSPNPCQRNGTCIDGIQSFTCDCIPGFTGATCETNIDECRPYNPCLNYGTCMDRINSYECDCTDTGFNGSECQNNIDDCVGVSCQHGSTCVDGLKDYDCACFDGYIGKDCETDINECLSSPCQYNGTCIERSKPDLYPQYAQLSNFTYATAGGYVCLCIPGITGVNCEIDIDECEVTPCKNGATCQDFINAYNCTCAPGYEGDNCEIDIDECLLYKACKNGATCDDQVNNYQCSCAPGYKGRDCEIDIDECLLYGACMNGATCEDRVADYSCHCPPFQEDTVTYGGKNCSVELVGCSVQAVLCQNGATCIPELIDERRVQHGYSCLCPIGFGGRYCNVSTTISFANGAKIVKQNVTNLELQFRFRTTLKSALLMAYQPSLGVYISIEIKDEHLYAAFGDASTSVSSRQVSTRSIVNDAEMHTVNVVIISNITIKVESSMCNSREECTVTMAFPQSFAQSQPRLFIGNVDQSVFPSSHSVSSFTGCMEDIIYNSRDYLVPSIPGTAQYDNIVEGCDRTDQCLPYTCNRHGDCLDLWNTFQCHCYRPYLGQTCQQEYVPATFSKGNEQSWANFVIPQTYRVRIQNHTELSLFVRTRQTDGVIMYFGNNQTTSRTFIALEIRNGKLLARYFFCGEGHLIQTTNDYNDGEAHFVKLDVMPRNISMSVDFGTPSSEKQFMDMKPISINRCLFDADVAYFGGKVPDALITRTRRRRQTDLTVNSFQNTSYFQGIIQDVEVNGIKLQFYPVNTTVNTTVPESLTMESAASLTAGQHSTELACDSSPCQQNGTCTDIFYNDFICECPYGYRGKDCSELDFCRNATCPTDSTCQSFHNGYECISSADFNGLSSLVSYSAKLNPATVIDTISVRLQTEVMYGALLYIQNYAYFMKLRVAEGQIQLNYKLKDEFSSELKVQYMINDGMQYDIVMSMIGNTINLQVQKNSTILKEASVTVDNLLTNLTELIQDGGVVYLGGIGHPRSDRKWEQPYRGCLEEARIAEFLLPFYPDSSFQNNNMRTQYFYTVGINNIQDGCPYSTPRPEVPGIVKNGGTCYQLLNGDYVCSCLPGFTGTLCEININDCTTGTCLNGGVCVDGVGNFTCKCRTGYTGKRCQNDEDFCVGTVCSNNGSCREVQTGFECDCTEDFTGVTCGTSLNQSCRTGLCQNGGTCVDINRTISSGVVDSFNCTCAGGYEGPLCEKPIDYCTNLPCGANGNCTSHPDSQRYSCDCDQGYTGSNCETNINNCANVCQNGGTCLDLDNDYNCTCAEGWTGQQCTDDINECDLNICQRGTCQNLPGGYICNCNNTGYEGDNCDQQVNECEGANPCLNDGECADTEGSYTCNCTLGYEGQSCEIPNCNASQCLNGATCRIENQQWECDCVQYYEGKQCEIAGPCLNQTCSQANTAECVQDVDLNNYTCNCQTGWEGENCTVNIDECSDGNNGGCENGATCVDTQGSYECQCVPGYSGRHCETDIDDCVEVDLCINGGICIDLVNNYTCKCDGTGYEGISCSVDIDECATGVDNCQENTECLNTDGGFKCPCQEGFIGEKCVRDPCQDTICEHDGSCNSSITDGGDYTATCFCSEGYEGSRCEKLGAVQQNSLNIWYIIGPVIAVVLLIVIIGIVIFFMIARTKRATRGTYSPSRQETSGARVELGNVLKKPPEERLI